MASELIKGKNGGEINWKIGNKIEIKIKIKVVIFFFFQVLSYVYYLLVQNYLAPDSFVCEYKHLGYFNDLSLISLFGFMSAASLSQLN